MTLTLLVALISAFREARADESAMISLRSLFTGVCVEVVEGVSLLKKSAPSSLRLQIGLEERQNRRIWCPIWYESGHEGSFSTRWVVFGTDVTERRGKWAFS